MADPAGRFEIDGQILGPIADPVNPDDVPHRQYVDSGLASKAAASHQHSMSDVTGLVSDLATRAVQADVTTALSGKSNTGHGHVQSDITDLVAALAAKADSSHTHAGLVTLARVNADVQNSSNSSFTNLFTIPILANEVWSFDCRIYFLTAATTTGIVLQGDSPASPAASQLSLLTGETATAVRNLVGAQGVALVGTAGLATVLEARLSGTIENGANAGNIVIKFRSEVNGSAVTVKRGSWGRFYKH